jgi:hypothetical protein
VESTLAILDVLERDVDAVIPTLALLVVQYRMAVEEGATPDILARDAHTKPLGDKTRVGASEDQQFNLLIVRTKLSCFTY